MKNSLIVLIPLLFFLFSLPIVAQKEGAIWYFGANAGLDFTTGNPIVLANSAMNTLEGCATICDASGNLLFYTNGMQVWNRQHAIMVNGTGLDGHFSAAQGTVIVPKPESQNIYYIFTVDAVENNLSNGLRYSTVDMSLNGGNGAVTTKNFLLQTPVVEKVIAVRHCNGRDFWIITHQWDSRNFLAYLLTSNGITSSPVISSVGSDISGSMWKASGCMKASVNGKYLAAAIRGEVSPSAVELFSFDHATGILSNPVQFLVTNDFSYGIEFSPDSKKLYISAGTYATTGKLYQIDISSDIPENMVASQTLISSSNSVWWGALQLAPDGKIYMAKWNANNLGIITAPNILGSACNFIDNGIGLAGAQSALGLPNLFPPYVDNEPGSFKIKGQDTICAFTSHVLYSLERDCSCSGTYMWMLQGKGNLLANSISATIDFTEAGIDTLIARKTTTCGTIEDTLFVHVLPLPVVKLGPDTFLCSRSIQLDAGSGFSSYEWQDGSNKQVLTVSSGGLYWVKVQNSSGCESADTIRIMSSSLDVKVSTDQSICRGDSVLLKASGAKYYSWMPTVGLNDANSPNPLASPTQTITYTVTGTDENGCTQQRYVTVTVVSKDHVHFMLGSSTVASGTKDYHIPLSMRTSQQYLPMILHSVRVEIRCSIALLFPSASIPGLVATSIDGDELILHLKYENINLKDTQQVLGEIQGLILLGDSSTGLLKLYVWIDDCPQSNVENGKLFLEACNIDARRVHYSKSMSLSVYPNPLQEETGIEISTEQTGTYRVGIFDIQGHCIWEKEFRHYGEGVIERYYFEISAHDFNAGCYQVLLYAPSAIRMTKLSVVK